MPAIQLHDVAKSYGGVVALHGIDLAVEHGEVFGFLGPNGAGKSTTIDILLRFTHPTSGDVEVLGIDVATDPVAVRRRTGVLPEGFSPFETMTGRQHVEYAIDVAGSDDDPIALLERVDVAHAADRRAAGYSKGMAQRLALAMALVGEPELLILDEPSTGLDPHGARRMREIVREERDRGATVFFSSHILEQVEAVADRVGILNGGRLVTVDTIDGLRAAVGASGELRIDLAPERAGPVENVGPVETGGGGSERVEAGGAEVGRAEATFEGDPLATAADPVAVAEAVDGVSGARREDGRLVVACRPDGKLAVLDALRDAGFEIRDFETSEASLEDLFVSYTEEP